MVVVEGEGVVSQYSKNLPSLSDVVGSSAPDLSLGCDSASSSNELESKHVLEKIILSLVKYLALIG